MKTTIKIKNFRSLEDVEIELAPTTILVGPNGAGKSSLLKLLDFVSQNIREINPRKRPKTIYKIGKSLGTSYNLGNFREVVTNNDRERIITFELLHTSQLLGEFDNLETGWLTLSDLVSDEEESIQSERKIHNELLRFFSAETREVLIPSLFENKYNVQLDLIKRYYSSMNFHVFLQFALNSSGRDLTTFQLVDKESNAEISIDYSKDAQLRHKPSQTLIFSDPLINQLLDSPNNKAYTWSSIYGKLDTWEDVAMLILNNHYERSIISELQTKSPNVKMEEVVLRAIAQVLRFFQFFPKVMFNYLNIDHIPSIRQIPQRLKRKPKEKYDFIGHFVADKSIVDITNKIIEFENKKVELENKPNNNYAEENIEFLNSYPQKKEKIDAWLRDQLNLYNYRLFKELRRLNLAKSIFIDFKGKLYEIKVETINGAIINISESSSGLLQLLPIIASTIWHDVLLSISPITMFVEQPELHLHPKLQAVLADICLPRENEPFKYSKFIMETHSEHIIRAYQLKIANKRIQPEHIRFYYFDNVSGTTRVTHLETDSLGNFITPWPNGFFSESSDLSFQLLEAQIKRNE